MTKLCQFVGFINFYCHLIPKCAQLVAPLDTKLPRKNKESTLTEEATEAFAQVNIAHAEVTLLAHHSKLDAPTSIKGPAELSVLFYSNTLTEHSPISQRSSSRHSIFGLVFLDAHLAVKHSHHFVEGLHFVILTDHKPLVYAVNWSASTYTPREICPSSVISEFQGRRKHSCRRTELRGCC